MHDGDNGPYVVLADDDAASWRVARREGARPSAEQSALSTRIAGLVILLSEMRQTSTVQRMFEHTRDVFEATLVRHAHGDVSQFAGDVDALERRVCRIVARPAHRRTVIQAQGTAFLFAMIGGLLAFAEMALGGVAPWGVDLDLSHLDTLLFLFCGVSLGRCVGLLISFYAPLSTVAEFRTLQEHLARPVSSALNDVVLSIVAYLTFTTHLIVIAVGGDGVSGGLSSVQIAQGPAMATVFGVLVGTARAGFLDRLTQIAHRGGGS